MTKQKEATDRQARVMGDGSVREDVWQEIDAIEEKYSELIDNLQSDDSRKPSLAKMKVTGASVREIPRMQARRTSQAKRRGKK